MQELQQIEQQRAAKTAQRATLQSKITLLQGQKAAAREALGRAIADGDEAAAETARAEMVSISAEIEGNEAAVVAIGAQLDQLAAAEVPLLRDAAAAEYAEAEAALTEILADGHHEVAAVVARISSLVAALDEATGRREKATAAARAKGLSVAAFSPAEKGEFTQDVFFLRRAIIAASQVGFDVNFKAQLPPQQSADTAAARLAARLAS